MARTSYGSDADIYKPAPARTSTVKTPVTRAYEISPNSGLPIYPPGYSGGTSSSAASGGYSQYGLDQYPIDSNASLRAELEAARLAQEEAAAQKRAAYESALRSQYGTSLSALGQGAAGANTSEYVRYMQNQAKLPQQAALMGTGGLSESSLMGLNAAYGGNLNAIELERARGQAGLENELAQGIAQGEGQYADTMAGIGSDYASKLLSLSLQEQANQLAREQALQQQAYSRAQDLQQQTNWEKQFGFNQTQADIENALNAQKFALSASKKASSGIGGGTSFADEDEDKTVPVSATNIYGPQLAPNVPNLSGNVASMVNYYRLRGYTDQQIADILNK